MFRRIAPRLCAAAGAGTSSSNVAANGVEFSIPKTPGKVRVMFITPDKKVVETYGRVGSVLMEVARDIAKIDVEAACDGTCACSTCHMYLDKYSFSKLKPPCEDELDMLDLAPEPRATSRLSCQVKLSEEVDGIQCVLPNEQSNQMM